MSNTTTPAENPSPSNSSNASKNSRAYASPASWLRFLIPAGLGIAADLALKSWSFPDGVPPAVLPPALDVPAGRHPATEVYDAVIQAWVPQAPSPIIPKVLGFTTTINHGAVFGSFQGHVSLFLTFSFFALAIIIWVFLTSLRKQWTVHIALGLITAGAIGNLYDRAVYHGVRDMLKLLCFQVQHASADGTLIVRDYYPYIFNIADALLCLGVPLLILCWMFTKSASQPRS